MVISDIRGVLDLIKATRDRVRGVQVMTAEVDQILARGVQIMIRVDRDLVRGVRNTDPGDLSNHWILMQIASSLWMNFWQSQLVSHLQNISGWIGIAMG